MKIQKKRIVTEMVRKYWFLILLIAIFSYLLFIIGIKCKYQQNRIIIKTINCNHDYLDIQHMIDIPDINESDKGLGFTCTGITYDLKDDTYWLGNYGKLHRDSVNNEPSLVEISADFSTVINQIPVEKCMDVQGIAYDKTNDSLWFSSGNEIINIRKDGSIINTFTLGKYQKNKPNGVAYDENTDSLWVLCSTDYLLNYDKEGNLLSVHFCSFIGQDHITIDSQGNIWISAGVDYRGEQNYILRYDIDKDECLYYYQLLSAYAIEGVCFKDENLLVVNDGYYHDALIEKNYVGIYFYKKRNREDEAKLF